MQHIYKTDSLSVYINDSALPIGETYKKLFFEKIKKFKL